MTRTKQIIVIRRDLNMPPGKLAAQVSHASMAFLTKEAVIQSEGLRYHVKSSSLPHGSASEVLDWIQDSYTKICLGVDSLEELENVQYYAIQAGLNVHEIIDNGLTCFNGVLTKTCIAIGPHYNEKFVTVTKHLKLY